MNMYAIARAAGVSRVTVSLTINGKADKYRIAKSTQERIMTIVRQTGYTPNLTLRNMFLKRRELVGIGGSAQPSSLADAIRPAIAAAGCELQTVTLSDDPAAASVQIAELLKSGKATLILPPAVVVGPVPPAAPTPAPTPTPTSESASADHRP